MAKEFQHRRDVLVNGLNQLPGLSCLMPEGAFYVWGNISKLGESADAIAAKWLEEALIAVVPGEGFGAPTHVRFSSAASLKSIEEALSRLAQWLKKR